MSASDTQGMCDRPALAALDQGAVWQARPVLAPRSRTSAAHCTQRASGAHALPLPRALYDSRFAFVSHDGYCVFRTTVPLPARLVTPGVTHCPVPGRRALVVAGAPSRRPPADECHHRQVVSPVVVAALTV